MNSKIRQEVTCKRLQKRMQTRLPYWQGPHCPQTRQPINDSLLLEVGYTGGFTIGRRPWGYERIPRCYKRTFHSASSVLERKAFVPSVKWHISQWRFPSLRDDHVTGSALKGLCMMCGRHSSLTPQWESGFMPSERFVTFRVSYACTRTIRTMQ